MLTEKGIYFQVQMFSRSLSFHPPYNRWTLFYQDSTPTMRASNQWLFEIVLYICPTFGTAVTHLLLDSLLALFFLRLRSLLFLRLMDLFLETIVTHVAQYFSSKPVISAPHRSQYFLTTPYLINSSPHGLLVALLFQASPVELLPGLLAFPLP